MPAMTHASPFRFLSRTLLALGVVAFLGACGSGYLDQDRKVKATSENSEVFEVVKAYHAAIQNKDLDALKKLISPRYHENAGTTEKAEDDYGYDKAIERLPMLRDNVKKIQLRIKLMAMEVGEEFATVDYEFVGRVLLTEGGVDSYKTWNDFNRMELAREGSEWRIVGGL
jgi:hypothetical protein